MGKPKKMAVKIKKEYASTVIAFGNSGLPLGQRDDLNELAIIAHQSQDPSLLELFDTLPSLEDLQREKVHALLPVIAPLLSKTEPEPSQE
jgi:hypothetical protein